MKDIKELKLNELKVILESWQEPAFHAKQIFSWIYRKEMLNFSQMSDLTLDLRRRLEKNFYILGLSLKDRIKSQDETEKFLFKLRDGSLIESTIIPAGPRTTACISTQVGCRFSCAFCASGMFGFKRNLETGEILDQVIFLNTQYFQHE